MSSLYYELLSEAFTSHGLFLPTAIYFSAILPFFERRVRHRSKLVRDDLACLPRMTMAGPSLTFRALSTRRISLPRIAEAKYNGWPIAQCRPWRDLNVVCINFWLRRAQIYFGDLVLPSRACAMERVVVRKLTLRYVIRKIGRENLCPSLVWRVERRRRLPIVLQNDICAGGLNWLRMVPPAIGPYRRTRLR